VLAALVFSIAMYGAGFRNLMPCFRILKAGYAAKLDLGAHERQHIFGK